MALVKEEKLRTQYRLDAILQIADETGFLSDYRFEEAPYSNEFREAEREIYKIAISKFTSKDPVMSDFLSKEEVIETVSKVSKDISLYAEEYYSEEMDPIEWGLSRDKDRD